ncbi:pentapeptide repeat-containing protein [Maricaulaceae bacterium NA33B04]|nr:pentapeptide repeat-containing protein [Maricaulaceae bacterium NA33B04]
MLNLFRRPKRKNASASNSVDENKIEYASYKDSIALDTKCSPRFTEPPHVNPNWGTIFDLGIRISSVEEIIDSPEVNEGADLRVVTNKTVDLIKLEGSRLDSVVFIDCTFDKDLIDISFVNCSFIDCKFKNMKLDALFINCFVFESSFTGCFVDRLFAEDSCMFYRCIFQPYVFQRDEESAPGSEGVKSELVDLNILSKSDSEEVGVRSTLPLSIRRTTFGRLSLMGCSIISCRFEAVYAIGSRADDNRRGYVWLDRATIFDTSIRALTQYLVINTLAEEGKINHDRFNNDEYNLSQPVLSEFRSIDLISSKIAESRISAKSSGIAASNAKIISSELNLACDIAKFKAMKASSSLFRLGGTLNVINFENADLSGSHAPSISAPFNELAEAFDAVLKHHVEKLHTQAQNRNIARAIFILERAKRYNRFTAKISQQEAQPITLRFQIERSQFEAACEADKEWIRSLSFLPGSEKWERAVEKFQKINFSGANCSGFDARGSDFAFANFADADLSNAKLSDSDFRGAVCYFEGSAPTRFDGALLSRVSFGGANLKECSFEGASLAGVSFRDKFSGNNFYAFIQNAIFTGATGLEGSEFRNLDLNGALLPEKIDDFGALSNIKTLSNQVRNLLVGLALAALYALLALRAQVEADSVEGAERILLPVLSVPFPPDLFATAAALVIAGGYVYMHARLRRVWRIIQQLPSRFPDGRGASDHIHPFVLTLPVGAIRPKPSDADRRDQKARPGLFAAIGNLVDWIAAFVAGWVMAPIALWLVWALSHNGTDTLGQTVILLSAITATAVGVLSAFSSVGELRRDAD